MMMMMILGNKMNSKKDIRNWNKKWWWFLKAFLTLVTFWLWSLLLFWVTIFSATSSSKSCRFCFRFTSHSFYTRHLFFIILCVVVEFLVSFFFIFHISHDKCITTTTIWTIESIFFSLFLSYIHFFQVSLLFPNIYDHFFHINNIRIFPFYFSIARRLLIMLLRPKKNIITCLSIYLFLLTGLWKHWNDNNDDDDDDD